jgi:hypothetical protein
MAGMPEMQEQFPASAMDGGHAEIAGAFFGGAWMARIPKTKEHFSPPWTAGMPEMQEQFPAAHNAAIAGNEGALPAVHTTFLLSRRLF